jgi:hypothetical protein
MARIPRRIARAMRFVPIAMGFQSSSSVPIRKFKAAYDEPAADEGQQEYDEGCEHGFYSLLPNSLRRLSTAEIAEYVPAQTKVRTAITPVTTAVDTGSCVSIQANAPTARLARTVGPAANLAFGYWDGVVFMSLGGEVFEPSLVLERDAPAFGLLGF